MIGITLNSFYVTIPPFKFSFQVLLFSSTYLGYKYELNNCLLLRGECFQMHSEHFTELILYILLATYIKKDIAIPEA